MSVSSGESSNTKNLVGSTDIDIIVSGDDISLELNSTMKQSFKQDIISSISFTPFILSVDATVSSTGSVASTQINYPTNCDKSNIYLIGCKFKDKNDDTVPYRTQYVSSYINNDTIYYEPTIRVNYQNNAMYIVGRSPIVDTDVTIELIFMKIS